MRVFLTILFMALSAGKASADCVCQCVNGEVQPVCKSPSELPPLCVPRACPLVPPSSTRAEPLISAPPSTTSAESPTTAPPSTTSAESPTTAPPSTTSVETGVAPPSTKPEHPAMPPVDTSLCFQRRVLNTETLQYEWQQSCQ